MLQHNRIFIQRMSGKIDTHQITFPVQTIQITPAFSFRNFRSSYVNYILTTEQRVGGSRLICLITVTIAYQSFQENFILRVHGKILLALQLRKFIETSCQSQTFQILLITSCQIDALHKVEYTFERTILLTFFHDIQHGTFAHTFHCTEAKTYISFRVNGELQVTLIHIRTKNFDAHSLTFVHQLSDIGNVRQTSTHYGCHILGRVISFQISRLISYP